MPETTNPQAAELLKRAESYLSALLAANLACAGCELRDQIRAALPTLSAVPPSALADRAELRDRIAEVLAARFTPDGEPTQGMRVVTDDDDGLPAARRVRPLEAADAVLAVLPEPADRAAGPAALREAAAFYETVLQQSLSPDSDPRYCTAVRDIVMGLRRRADEAEPAAELRRVADEAPQTAEAPCCSDPTCTCNQVNAAGRCECTKWESGPGRVPDEAQQDETQADCPHCPDGHTPPTRGSQPWSAWVASERDGDGQPMQIIVARSAGAHVAESDAQWVRDVLNGRADSSAQELPLDHPLRRECRCSEAGVCRRCSERASVAAPAEQPAVVSQPGKEA